MKFAAKVPDMLIVEQLCFLSIADGISHIWNMHQTVLRLLHPKVVCITRNALVCLCTCIHFNYTCTKSMICTMS